MLKAKILGMLEHWPDNIRIRSIRFNTWGEIVVEDENCKFYIFSNGELKKFST